MFSRCATHARRNSPTSGVIVPFFVTVTSTRYFSRRNFRMVSVGARRHQRRDDDVDTGAIRQARIDQTAPIRRRGGRPQ